jgi:hypothetical protein
VRAALRELQNQSAHLRNPSTSFGSLDDKKGQELEYQAAILRDVVEPAFGPVAFNRGWLTPAVTALAGGIAAAGDFSGMPILADALEEGGCNTPEILGHCRGPVPHVRGCWVIDFFFKKE